MQLTRLKIGAATILAGASLAGVALFTGAPMAGAQALGITSSPGSATTEARLVCNDAGFCFHTPGRRFVPYFYGAGVVGADPYGINLNNAGGAGADGSGLAAPD